MRKFNGSFSQENLEKTIKEIIVANQGEMYNELMYLRKWLGLCMDHTNNTLDGYNNGVDGYDNGVDVTGARMVNSTEVWRCEVLHFTNKKERIQKAIDVCDKYAPFKD